MEPENETLESSPPSPRTQLPSNAGEGDSGAATETKPEISDLDKKQRPAERFGMTFQLSEEERRTSRAERFGTGTGSVGTGTGSASLGKNDEKKVEEDKRKARAERFGLAVEDGVKKKARGKKITMNPMPVTPEEEEKRKARTLRFSGTANTASKVNGKDKLDLNAAVVENKQEA